MAFFIILYSNYYPLHGEFNLICIGKFASRTWVNVAQQYGKNRQSSQQNTFYYAVWQLLLYFYREFPSKILSVCLLSAKRETLVWLCHENFSGRVIAYLSLVGSFLPSIGSDSIGVPGLISPALIVSLVFPIVDFCCLALNYLSGELNTRVQRLMNCRVSFVFDLKCDVYIGP